MNSNIKKQWKQPVLTANGILGGSSFAVSAKDFEQNSDANSGDAYYAFAGNGKYWRSKTSSSYIILYNPIPLRINKLYCSAYNTSTNSYGTMASGTISGSNDNSSWTKITDFTNKNFGTYTIMVNSPSFYKYYKVEGTCSNGRIHLSLIIDAIYQQTISLSDMDSPQNKIKAEDYNSISENVDIINKATGTTAEYQKKTAIKGNIIQSIDISSLRDAINALNSNFQNNCCQQNYNDCCETCQSCQYCETCQTCQGCQSTTCQSSSCQTTSCQSCQTCQGCQSQSCQSQSCQRQCRNCLGCGCASSH